MKEMIANLSGTKKALLILAFLIVIIFVVLFAYKSHQHAEYLKKTVVNGLFGGLAFYTPYDENTREEYVEFFNEARNKRSVQKELAAVVDEFVEIALNNDGYFIESTVAQYNGSSKPEERKMEDRYGNKRSILKSKEDLSKAVKALDELGYEDQSIQKSIRRFFEQERQLILDGCKFDGNNGHNEYMIAIWLEDAKQSIDTWNQVSGDFYKIDNALYSKKEIRDFYEKAIDLAYKADDKEQFAKALSVASESSLVGDKPYMKSDKIIDFFVSDSSEILTTLNGIGGYYDFEDQNKKRYYYGDFYYAVTTTGGNQYDTSEFTPGLWNALTPAQREEIRSGNTEKTYVTQYCRGEEADCGDIRELAKDNNFHYAFLNQGDTKPAFVFVSKRAIQVLYPNFSYKIKGDFTDIYNEMKAHYANAAGSSLEEEADSETEENLSDSVEDGGNSENGKNMGDSPA